MMISQTAVLNSHRLDVGSTLNSKTASHNARDAASRVHATASCVVLCQSNTRSTLGTLRRWRHDCATGACGPPGSTRGTPGRPRPIELNAAWSMWRTTRTMETARQMQRAFDGRCAALRTACCTRCVARCELYAAQWHQRHHIPFKNHDRVRRAKQDQRPEQEQRSQVRLRTVKCGTCRAVPCRAVPRCAHADRGVGASDTVGRSVKRLTR
jgi:hypothetical protein